MNKEVTMPFFKGFSRRRWMLLLGAMGIGALGDGGVFRRHLNPGAQTAGATLKTQRSGTAMDRRGTARVIVASKQYPLYLFKDEQGQWSGLYESYSHASAP